MRMLEKFLPAGLDGEVVAFISDMPAAFADADLVVCRAGAGAVSELAAAGKPSILVPFPFAADDHQTVLGGYGHGQPDYAHRPLDARIAHHLNQQKRHVGD